MSVLVGLAAIWAQEAGGALSSVESWPWIRRVESSLVAYAAYCGDFFWPTRLRCSTRIRFRASAVCGYFCLRRWSRRARHRGARRHTAGASRCRNPLVSGDDVARHRIVTVGEQARADRYTYIPSVGSRSLWSGGSRRAGQTGWRSGGESLRP